MLSFWLQVSEPTIEFTVRMEDTDGTVSFMLFNEVYWGPLFYPGKWYHIEWPFKDLPASVTYYIDSLEVMTKQEWRRSKEEYPMIEPTDYAYANDRFQLGMYVDVVVGAGKLFPDMKNHGVDFIGVYHNRYDNHVFKNASYVRKLGLRVDSEYYPSDEDPHEI